MFHLQVTYSTKFIERRKENKMENGQTNRVNGHEGYAGDSGSFLFTSESVAEGHPGKYHLIIFNFTLILNLFFRSNG